MVRGDVDHRVVRDDGADVVRGQEEACLKGVPATGTFACDEDVVQVGSDVGWEVSGEVGWVEEPGVEVLSVGEDVEAVGFGDEAIVWSYRDGAVSAGEVESPVGVPNPETSVVCQKG